jgi:hypothetical protein
LIRLTAVLIVSIAALAAAPRSESADKNKKPASAPMDSAAPAKPSPSPSASPSTAPASGKISEQEKALRDRVTEYWKIRATSNLHACYPFYEASFRSKYTPDQFATDFRRLNRFAPEFLGIDGVILDPSGAKATVKVKLRTRPDVLQGQELISSVEETWLVEDGIWNKAGELTFPNI